MRFIPLLLWSFPIALGLHVLEEFAYPGDLRQWIRTFKPRAPRSNSYYFAINATAIVGAMLIALFARGPIGMGLYLYSVALMAGNAASHLRGSMQIKRYCPGSITGGVLLLPLLLVSCWLLTMTGKLDPLWTMLCASIGAIVGWMLFGVDVRRNHYF